MAFEYNYYAKSKTKLLSISIRRYAKNKCITFTMQQHLTHFSFNDK